MEGFEGCGVVARTGEQGWMRHGAKGEFVGWGEVGIISEDCGAMAQFRCGAPCKNGCCNSVLCRMCAIRLGVTW